MNWNTRKPFPSVLQRVEYSLLPASRGAAHDVCCLATQPCHQLTPFYQSRLTQTQLIISFQAACECRTLQLDIKTPNATHFAVNEYTIALYIYKSRDQPEYLYACCKWMLINVVVQDINRQTLGWCYKYNVHDTLSVNGQEKFSGALQVDLNSEGQSTDLHPGIWADLWKLLCDWTNCLKRIYSNTTLKNYNNKLNSKPPTAPCCLDIIGQLQVLVLHVPVLSIHLQIHKLGLKKASRLSLHMHSLVWFCFIATSEAGLWSHLLHWWPHILISVKQR